MKSALKEKIFSKIEKEKIEPIAVSYFKNKNRFLWAGIGLMLVLATIFGGFFLTDLGEFFSFGGAGGKNAGLLGFPVFLWFVVIVFILYFGIRIFRSTPVGYRYSFWKDLMVITGILFLSILLLRGTGLGAKMHGFFVQNIPYIGEVVYRESLWNNAENGRLAGKIMKVNSDTITLQDTLGKIWNIDIKKSFISPKASLSENEKIRITGNKIGETSFESERILPWFGEGSGNGKNNGGRGGGRGKGRGENND